MPALEDYIFDMESWTVDALSGAGMAVLSLTSEGTGTCGVTTPQTGLPLPLPDVTAQGDWQPLGVCALPTVDALGAQEGWRPGWGAPELPLPVVTGEASQPLRVNLVLPALFYAAAVGVYGESQLPVLTGTARCGAWADAALPMLSPYALSDCDQHGTAACLLPAIAAKTWSCSLENPVQNGTDAATIVGLLCQGNTDLAKAALALANGATLESLGADVLAGRLLAAVAENLTYAADTDDDVWTCALGTYTRGFGDCEDGAMLLHALLLAAGIAPDRLITVFGRVGVNREGHAWLTYRRESDGAWVVLDWTAATAATTVASLTPIGDLPSYATVDYALTAQSFLTVRQTPTQFFSSVAAVTLSLPVPDLEAAASLGTVGACSLAARWLTLTTRTGTRGKVGLSGPTLTASTKSSTLAATLAAPAIQGRAGAAGTLTTPKPSVTSWTFGGWGKAALVPPGLILSAQAVHIGNNDGVLTLARTTLAALGLSGLGGVAAMRFSKPTLAAQAWPGELGHGAARVPLVVVTCAGNPSDPASGLVPFPVWQGNGIASPDDGSLANYHWQHALLEAW